MSDREHMRGHAADYLRGYVDGLAVTPKPRARCVYADGCYLEPFHDGPCRTLTDAWDATATTLPDGWTLALQWDEDGHHAIARHLVPWTPATPLSRSIIETAEHPWDALAALADKLREIA